MADNPGGGNGGGLYFIVGALVVAVFVVGFVALGGHVPGTHPAGGGAPKVELNVTPPAAPGK